jgi:hypothetical protein
MIMSRDHCFLSRPLAIALLVWCLACATAAAANNCTDGGRSRPDEGGVGGTGLQPTAPDDDDSGVGGTGISAGGDTGIIGTVTGFASICVGGVEIHYGADTPVQMDGTSATAARLAVGQVVEVVATGSGSEMNARQITVRHVVSGPVTRVDYEHNEIDVIGQTVQLSPVTRGGNEQQDSAVAAAYPLSSFVQVSGMRRADGVVVASRVSRTEVSDVAQVAGPVTKSASGMLTIAGTPVHIDSGTHLAIGDEVRVVGNWDGGAIAARSVESIPRVPFDGRVARVDIEGFARQTTGQQLQVGAFSVELPAAAAQDAPRLSAPDTRIRIQGIVRDRHVIVEHIGLMDELPSLPPFPQRNTQGLTGGRPGGGREAIGAPPPDKGELGEHDGPPARDGQNARPEGNGGSAAPSRPERSDRPPALQIPDRPSMPQVPDRPSRPEIPDHPAVPQIPDRPARPERPPAPARPDMRGRP